MPDQAIIIDPNGLYTYERLASVMNVCNKTLRRMVEARELPQPFKKGRKYYWHGSSLHSFFRAEQDRVITGRAS